MPERVRYIIVRISEFICFASCGACLAKTAWVASVGCLALGIVCWAIRARMERDFNAK